MSIKALSADEFDEFVANNELIVIEFGAAWCAPCNNFQMVLEQLAPKHPDFAFATVDVDKEDQLAKEFEVRSVPMVLILRKSVIVYAESGALSASVFEDLLEQARAMA